MTQINERHLAHALTWALDAMHQPQQSYADWLAMDINPDAGSATGLLADPTVSLDHCRKAKAAFKTMRVVAERSSERRLAARLYTAAIAAGLVRHGKRVTRQNDAALRRAFQGLLDDRTMPMSLRDLAGTALCVLDGVKKVG